MNKDFKELIYRIGEVIVLALAIFSGYAMVNVEGFALFYGYSVAIILGIGVVLILLDLMATLVDNIRFRFF